MQSRHTRYHRSINASQAYDLVRLYTAHLYFHALKTLPLQYYTVDVQLTVEPNVILLSDRGHTSADMDLKYTIRPYTVNPDGTVDQKNI